MAKNRLEEAAREIVENEENVNETTSLGNVNEISRNSGKGFNQKETNDLAKEIGFLQVPLQDLPSGGLFYPEGTKIFIKAAQGAEVKHWSTIDEEDHYNIDDVLNHVIERCVKVSMPDRRASFKDLKDLDRFWLIFAVREYTFKDGENKLYADIPNSKNETERVEITKDVINYYNPNQSMMRFYNETKKCFTFTVKSTGEVINLYIPSVGVSSFLKDYRRVNEAKRQKIDEDFAMYAVFLFDDYKALTVDSYLEAERNSIGWSVNKISVLSKFVEFVKESINPSMTVNTSDGEVTVPLNFRGGLKAIFLVQDIMDELE